MVLFIYLLACADDQVMYEKFTVGEPESQDIFTDNDLPNGTYALKVATAEQLQDPSPLGNDWEVSQSVCLQIVTLQREETEISYETTTCDLRITETFSTQTTIPDRFYDATSKRTRSASLANLQVGTDFDVPLYFDLNGVSMNQPANENMPSSGNDSRIFDHDDDEQPGFTANISMGVLDAEIYLSQRIKQEFQGIVINPERIEGNVWSRNEQFIIDASINVFAIDISRKPKDDPDLNWFILQKVDEGSTCKDILNNEDDIF